MSGQRRVPGIWKGLKRKRILELEEFAVEIRHLDTVDLTIKMKGVVQIIEMLASTSTNLKGTYVKKLKLAARSAACPPR